MEGRCAEEGDPDVRRSADIVFGVTGQTLLHRVHQGRPSSATFEVFHECASDEDEPEWSGTATVDSVDATLAAAAGVGQSDRASLTLDAGGASVESGRRYRLSQNGRVEWALIVSRNGNSLVASAPLQNAYSTGADFESTYLSAAVDAAWVADDANLSEASDPTPDYRVRWEIVVGGATLVQFTFFSLVRGALEHGITMHDVEARFWNLIDDTPIDHRADGGSRLIDAAWEDVQADLSGNSIRANGLRDAQLLDQLLIHRIRLICAANGRRPADMSSEAFLAYAEKEYQRFLERHFLLASTVATAVGTGGSSARTKASPPIWRK
jgi:hypothetical protein